VSGWPIISAETLNAFAEHVAEIVLGGLRTEREAPAWLGVDGAAEYLQTTPDAIRALVKRKKIPHYKPNGRILFDRFQLDKWVRGELDAYAERSYAGIDTNGPAVVEHPGPGTRRYP